VLIETTDRRLRRFIAVLDEAYCGLDFRLAPTAAGSASN